MFGVDSIIPLLNAALLTGAVQSFLIRLGASALWYGVEKVARAHNCDTNLGSQTWDVLRNTMQ
ncbi:hypothetical protein [Pectinatus brassicae]|uniref:Uncharacterized protein n=1 Tax=Pectinatus brassicae TaxID=862415 RepID=A0A840UXI4_9FIRM|nr:hypothetical protein [Pectinatus brassicae]MBB5337574.1 hypothetical protein [Pectinatus brassicae]